MESQVESEIQALAGEKIESEQTQKTNLEEKNHHKHHVSKVSMSFSKRVIPIALQLHHLFCLRMFTNYVLTLCNNK